MKKYNWHTKVGDTDYLSIVSPETEENSPNVYLNNAKYVSVKQGLNLVIYDTLTDTLVESVGFPISGNRLSYEKHKQ